MELLDKNIEKLSKLCNKYSVLRLYVFGSALNDKFRLDSDIDFLVTFDSVELNDYADNYFDFKFSLEDLFNRKIDLLEEKAIRNPFLKQSIDTSKELIYG
ncbi:MAG: nucleotidyltransferase domain-containing protein [Bacteroidetes bacterium]|nr:nucleotidyltransferase domain-containing protein [Bacteroidota bacterium]MBU1677798.1 nucleotidyltransferase domain-containing protein [Bacteroidota bacterium]MBU2508084.1 nucleotidyltransferase domain-containing protein [Bacteroidota bacterium]